MGGSKLQLALRELQDFARSIPLWLTFVAIVALFVITGPYGTEAMPLGSRLGFWLMLHACAWTTAILGVVLSETLVGRLFKHELITTMIGVVAASPAVGLVIMLVNWSWGHTSPGWEEFGSQTLAALPLTLVFSVISMLVMRSETGTRAAQNEDQGKSQSSLLRRLKPETRGDILHLTAEDHYTAVNTTRGRELILIRFSDALKELEAEEGIQAHRSHWVAKAYVDALERDNGKLSLRLKNGAVIPVSRTYAPEIRKYFV